MLGLLDVVWEALLDRSIVFSYDRSGFRRHAARFRTADLDVDLTGKTALVTGGASGIGKETARGLAARGASVVLLCRDARKGEAAAAEIAAGAATGRVSVELLDVAELSSVRHFARRLSGARVDVLVNNAGVLPAERQVTSDGLELTLATNLAGPFLLTHLLLPALAKARGRVVNVSSGGMYTQRLDVAALVAGGGEPFDGVVQYARTKRALVVLTELMAERWRPRDVTFSAMHPGWADTPAVRSSIPRFHRVTKAILRSPAEGADTVVWLAASPAAEGRSGLFWFDREPQPAHLLGFTREPPAEREALWRELHRLAGVRPGRASRP